jgi:hypothetical protein
MLFYNGAFRGKKLGVLTYYAPYPPGTFPTSPRETVAPAPSEVFEARPGGVSQDAPLSMRADAASSEARSFPLAAAVVAAGAMITALVV